jgi:hypothetical protein
MIEVIPGRNDNPARLSFTWHDEFGKVLHRHVKK